MTLKEYRAWLAEHDFIGVAHRKKHEREAAQAAEKKQIKPMDTTSKTKKCKVCGKELPIEEFSKHAKTKDSYHTTCKGCMAVKRGRQLAKAEKIVSTEALKPQLEATTCDIGDIPDWILKTELERRGYIVKIYKEIHL